MLLGSWPSQVAGWGREALTAYLGEMERRDVSPEEVAAALRSSTSSFPPSAGELYGAIERMRQGPPPEFMMAARVVASKITLLDYYRPGSTFDKFVEAVSAEHEAIGRWAVQVGPRGLREMPDPTRVQERSADANAVRSHEFAYKSVVKAWEADPTPGVALTEAIRATITSGEGNWLDRLRPQGALEQGDE